MAAVPGIAGQGASQDAVFPILLSLGICRLLNDFMQSLIPALVGIGAAAMGRIADAHGIAFVYQLCSYLPAIGLVAWLLPNLERKPN